LLRWTTTSAVIQQVTMSTMARGVFAKKCRFIESGLRQGKTNVRFGSPLSGVKRTL
jgi:hypothetical protein